MSIRVPLLQEMAMRDATQDTRGKTEQFDDLPKHQDLDQGL